MGVLAAFAAGDPVETLGGDRGEGTPLVLEALPAWNRFSWMAEVKRRMVELHCGHGVVRPWFGPAGQAVDLIAAGRVRAREGEVGTATVAVGIGVVRARDGREQ